MKRTDFYISMLLALVLTACGGGDSSDNNGDNTTPPSASNTAPVISGLSDVYRMMERAELTIPFSVTDAEGDTITLSVISSNAAVTASLSGQKLLLVTADINQNTSTTVTLSASDGQTSSSKSFILNITKNNAPVISGLSDTYQMEENAQILLPFTVTDTEGDEITLSTASSDPIITISYNGNSQILLIAGEITRDISVTISLTASDGKLASTKEFILTVMDKPVVQPPEPTKAPVIAWSSEYGDTPTFSVNEMTMEDFVFTVSDEDSDISQLNITYKLRFLTSLNDTDKSSIIKKFSIDIDKVSGVARMRIPNSTYGKIQIAVTLNVVDEKSNESSSKELFLAFSSKSSVSYLDDLSNKYPLVGEESLINTYFVSRGNEINSAIKVSYSIPEYNTTNPLGIKDLTKNSFSVTPIPSVANELVAINISFEDSTGLTSQFSTFIKPINSGSIESVWNTKIQELKKLANASAEYEKIASYFNDELFFSKKINSDIYLSNKRKIQLSDDEMITNNVALLENRYHFVLNGLLQKDKKMEAAFDELINRLTLEVEARIDNPFESISVLNELVNDVYPSMYLFNQEKLVLLSDGSYSRFIGNTAYGYYEVSGKWVFSTQYDFLNDILMH
ncbi:Ig-like domain-containing protein [Shewanella mangrovisoli]|uniref:Ig-like domain-containing protein n=1 Tax=Shewanella mangrovisoli TaxID=2864211 RepID=UPI0035B9C920